MSRSSSSGCREAFCSYCGRPPTGSWVEREHRVCRRCHLGIVLRTSADTARLTEEPFVIVDGSLTVQAMSGLAELALQIDEPRGVGARLDQLLTGGGGDSPDLDLGALIMGSLRRPHPDDTFELRTVRGPETHFTACVSRCGPPPAALVILTPLTATPARAPVAAHGGPQRSVGSAARRPA
jgi:hypothetical protein